MTFAILETEGGKIATLIFMIVFLSICMILMIETHHQLQETGRTLIASAYSSLFALLVAKLGGKEQPKG